MYNVTLFFNKTIQYFKDPFTDIRIVNNQLRGEFFQL